MLEADFEPPGRPAVLLLHGFPDIAYSWRKTMLPLAEAGYHAIAPDQRGYGATTGWDNRYGGEVTSFRTYSYARDALGVLKALGYRSAKAMVGYDFGSMIAAYCALVRPDVFRSLFMMSLPFDRPPSIPFDTAANRWLPERTSRLQGSVRAHQVPGRTKLVPLPYWRDWPLEGSTRKPGALDRMRSTTYS